MELPVLCVTLQQIYFAQVLFPYMLFQSSSHADSNNGAEILLIDMKFELFDICCGEGDRGEEWNNLENCPLAISGTCSRGLI